jgi:flagellar L-ring protein precursor FlgH
MKLSQLLLLILVVFVASGCATLKDFLGEDVSKNVPFLAPEPALKYSDTPQAGVTEDREYRKMTRARMEEESELGAQAGSLWVMEGQTSYLFAQNKSRQEGDLLKVKLEGMGLKQIEAKAQNVRALLKEIEEERKRRENPEPVQSPVMSKAPDGGITTAGGRAPTAAPAPATPAEEKPKEEKIDLSDVEIIPSKIVEKLADGSYRVKGQQTLMIDKKEYRVILSGVLKPEDANDQGVSSAALIDPQYDLVSLGRAMQDDKIN